MTVLTPEERAGVARMLRGLIVAKPHLRDELQKRLAQAKPAWLVALERSTGNSILTGEVGL